MSEPITRGRVEHDRLLALHHTRRFGMTAVLDEATIPTAHGTWCVQVAPYGGDRGGYAIAATGLVDYCEDVLHIAYLRPQRPPLNEQAAMIGQYLDELASHCLGKED